MGTQERIISRSTEVGLEYDRDLRGRKLKGPGDILLR